MGLLDNMKDKAQDMMNDPATKARIEQMMKDHNITKEEAMQRIHPTSGE